MKNYVDAIALQEYTTKLVAKLKTLFPGTPAAAATVAAMTDHNKTYVYVGTETGYTAGDWYYWDGSAWASGGPFQATSIITDTTLAVAGEAADAKATGDAIAAAKAAVLNAMAPAYSPSATYAVGAYVNHNGAIYRCTTAITTAEAWTAGHWAAVPLGADLEGQVSDLKTQINNTENGTEYDWAIGSLYEGNGKEIDSDIRIRSEYIEVSTGTKLLLVEPEYRLIVYTYDKFKHYINSSGWMDGNNYVVSNPDARFIRVLIRKDTTTNPITEEEVEGLASGLTIFFMLPESVYTELPNMEENINKLNEYTTKTLKSKKIELKTEDWVPGSKNIGTGEDVDATNRLRSAYIDITEFINILVQIDNGYKWALYAYDSNKSYLQNKSITTWQTGTVEINLTDIAYISFLVADTSDGNVTKEYKNHIHTNCESYLQNSIDVLSPNNNVLNNTSNIFQWEIGTLNSMNGDEMDGNTRIRSAFISVGKNSVVKLSDKTNYRHLVYIYDLNKDFIDDGDWKDTDITIENDCYIRILVRYSDNRTITSEAISTIVNNESVEYKLAISTLSYQPKKVDSEWEQAIKAQAEIIKQKKTDAENYGACDAKLLFFTDVHKDEARTKNLAQLADGWNTAYFDALICGGDIVATIGTESLDWYYSTFESVNIPLLNVVGNHDAWESLAGMLLPKTTVYTSIIKPTVASGSFIQPENAETNGYNYYYKDFNNKVRLIVLDCMYWDSVQLTWLESVLADAKTNNMHVVCSSHAAFPLVNMTAVDCLWSKSGVNTDSIRTSIEAAGAVKDFMDGGGKFVAWIVGHQHGDYVHKLENYGNQFVINLGSFAQRASFLLKSTDIKAYNYNCMTYITVDTTNSILRLLRIGADIDIYGTKHNGLVIDYGNKSLISSWS